MASSGTCWQNLVFFQKYRENLILFHSNVSTLKYNFVFVFCNWTKHIHWGKKSYVAESHRAIYPVHFTWDVQLSYTEYTRLKLHTLVLISTILTLCLYIGFHSLTCTPPHMAFCHFLSLRSLRFLFLTCISNCLSDIFPITSVVLNARCQWSFHIWICCATCSREQHTVLYFLFPVVYFNSVYHL